MTWGGTGPSSDERFLGGSEWSNDTTGTSSSGTNNTGGSSGAASNAPGSVVNNTNANNNHSVSQPIPMQRRAGGGSSNNGNGNDVSAGVNHDPTTNAGLLSPRSAENLGLKLVNYILDDNSPSVKELETRVKGIKLGKSSGASAGNSTISGGGVNAGGGVDSQDNDAALTDSTSSSKADKTGRGSSKQSQHQQQTSLGVDQSNASNQQVVCLLFVFVFHVQLL